MCIWSVRPSYGLVDEHAADERGYPTPEEARHLSAIVAAAPQEDGSHSSLVSPLGAQLPLHISLSRPVVLATDQREPFTELLRRSIASSGTRP